MKALIVGHTGQDGILLTRLLLQKQYDVFGISSDQSYSSSGHSISKVNIRSASEVDGLIKQLRPDEIYFLAAVHHSSSDVSMSSHPQDLWQHSLEVNSMAFFFFCESVIAHCPLSKIFYAASSHVFGTPDTEIQDESTPYRPECIYGITKTAGLNACSYFRKEKDLHVSAAIFYNHESSLRPSKFVSKKIVETAAAIKFGQAEKLELGSLSANIDWGFAPDYMQAVKALVDLKQPETCIIASGELRTVNDFARAVFNHMKIDPKGRITENPSLIRSNSKKRLSGNPGRIQSLTGWKPEHSFTQWVGLMADDALKKYEPK